MPAASASKTSVRSLSVRDRAELKKWITYKAHYSYQVLCMCGRLKTKHGSMICAHKCLHEHPQRENFTSETFTCKSSSCCGQEGQDAWSPFRRRVPSSFWKCRPCPYSKTISRNGGEVGLVISLPYTVMCACLWGRNHLLLKLISHLTVAERQAVTLQQPAVSAASAVFPAAIQTCH